MNKVSQQAISLKGPGSNSNSMALRKKESNKEGPWEKDDKILGQAHDTR